MNYDDAFQKKLLIIRFESDKIITVIVFSAIIKKILNRIDLKSFVPFIANITNC